MTDTLRHWQFEFESRPGLATKTYRAYCVALERIVGFLGPEKDPKNVFHADVLRYRDERLKRVASATVQSEIRVGKAFYNYLAQRGVVEAFFNPFKNVRYKEKVPDDVSGTVELQPTA